METTLTLTVNDRRWTVITDPRRTLLEVLREDLGLLGTKYACGEGQCGACSVLLDGNVARSCVTPVGRLDGAEIVTIEGLAEGENLHPLQQAFLDEGALQCGYCTAGMILNAVDLLNENPEPTEQDIIDGMNGNICRCNGYPKILRAIQRAAESMKG